MVSMDSIYRDINFYWNSSLEISQNRIKVLNKPSNFEEIDATAILTEWDEFKNFDYGNSCLFDGRNLLEKSIINYYRL